MSERLKVDAPAPLLAFLRSNLDSWAVRTLKMRLRLGCVQVNGNPARRHDHALQVGDLVEIVARGDGEQTPQNRVPFTVLFSDDELIAIDKPAGLLSVASERDRRRTALALVRDSLSTPEHQASLWPVHRLDRETSGVLLFARSREICDALQDSWAKAQKTYLAVVDGHPQPSEGLIDEPLWEDQSLNVRVGRRPDAKDARTRFVTRDRGRWRALLEIELLTGRRHQIRAHLAWIGHPVTGDRRYGAAGPRMGLHALRLCVTHPVTDSELVLEAPLPKVFSALLAGRV
ncbi:MAG: RluA family pseudouridine synthase [Planctomycetota bacterium]